jgi:hypothetical protein
MNRVRLKVADKPAPLSPERQKLATTIIKREELKRRIAGIAGAAESAMGESWELDAQLETAQAEIPKAEKRSIDAHVNAAMGRKAEPEPTVAEAKNAVANLEEQVETCRQMRKALEAEVETAQSRLGSVTSEIQARVDGVIWSDPSTLRLLADLELAIKTKTDAWAGVQALGVLPNDKQHFAVINNEPDRTKAAAWAQWRKALETDPAAAPPS